MARQVEHCRQFAQEGKSARSRPVAPPGGSLNWSTGRHSQGTPRKPSSSSDSCSQPFAPSRLPRYAIRRHQAARANATRPNLQVPSGVITRSRVPSRLHLSMTTFPLSSNTTLSIRSRFPPSDPSHLILPASMVLAQASRRVTVRLKTRAPGLESLASTQK